MASAHIDGCAATAWREIRYPDGTRLWVCEDCGGVRQSRPRDKAPITVEYAGEQ